MHRPAVIVVGALISTLVLVSCLGGEVLPCSDGDRVVSAEYSGEYGWHRQLFITDGHGRDARTITPEDGNAEDPTFSPDGEHVAYPVGLGDYESSGPQDFTVWTVRADGSDRTRITGPEGWNEDAFNFDSWSDTDPDWSPTRDEIVYRHTGPMPSRPAEVAAAAVNHGIFVVVPGEDPRRVTDTGDPEVIDSSPAWSPDGNQIAFVRSDGNMSEAPTPPALWVVDRDGSNAKRVIELPAGGEPFAWSQDGTALMLGGAVSGPPPGFRSIDLATGSVTELGPPLRELVWSAHGDRLYGLTRGFELVVTHLDDDPPTFEPRGSEDGDPLLGYEFDLAACG